VDVIVRGKHFDVPEPVEERARKKLGRLPHYLPLLDDSTAEVDIAHEKAKEPGKRFVINVTVSGHGVHLQAQSRAAQPETAVDRVVQALTRQARRQKDFRYTRTRVKAAKTPRAARARAENSGMPKDLSRVKRFAVKPMTTVEALEQMEMLKHDFFLFQDADAGQVALLYRRRAGDYGLIVPELS
jgi:putative sigma-54 modulation protein